MGFSKKAAAAVSGALLACALLAGCAGQQEEEMPKLQGTGEVSGGRTEAVISETQRDTLSSPKREGTSFTQFMKLDESYSAFMYSEDMVEFAEKARAAIAGQGGDPNGLVKCYPERVDNADGTVTAFFMSPPDPAYGVHYSFTYDPAAPLGGRIGIGVADEAEMPELADDQTAQ